MQIPVKLLLAVVCYTSSSGSYFLYTFYRALSYEDAVILPTARDREQAYTELAFQRFKRQILDSRLT